MKVEPYIEKLNEKTENKYKFILKSAILDRSADFCMIELLYKDGIMLDQLKKKEILQISNSILPNKYQYKLKFIKNFISEERISDDFENFMKTHFPSISYRVESVQLNHSLFIIDFNVDELSFEHAKKKNLDESICKYFKEKYEDFEFEVNYKKDIVFKIDKIELLKENYIEEEPDMSELRKIEVQNKEVFIGEEILDLASYIKDKKEPVDEVVFCGKIKNFKEVILKRKLKEKPEKDDNNKDNNKDKKETETKDEILDEKEKTDNLENSNSEINIEEKIQEKDENFGTRKLYKWTLDGFTGSVPCVFFSNKENQPKMITLEDGNEIIVKGKLEEDKYNGGITLAIKDISKCELPKTFEEKIIYRKEKPFYEFVKPEKIVTYEQNNLLNFMEEKVVPPYLKDKVFVCYDFETTGLQYATGDRIIEIGAVKIDNGKITEKFMSFVDPERPIPAKSSEISGIVDEDVKGAPKDYQVLQDFFKFTRGAIIIGYNNINFDNVFLIGQGKSARWDFASNETEDVYKFAQKYVHGVKNYKLGTIAEKLGVTLDNAHRAVYDALATAEVFIKLAENIK